MVITYERMLANDNRETKKKNCFRV